MYALLYLVIFVEVQRLPDQINVIWLFEKEFKMLELSSQLLCMGYKHNPGVSGIGVFCALYFPVEKPVLLVPHFLISGQG